MQRGDLVVCSLSGDFGKPRPAVIVQTNLLNETHSSTVVCPITSCLIDAPLFRILVKPTPENGLLCDSQIMIDRISALRTEKIGSKIGELSIKEIQSMDDSLKFLLNID